MMHKVSECIIAYAVKNNMLSPDKEEEYIYGLELCLSVVLSYFSVIIIGVFMGMLWQAVLFILLFASVRRFGGGLHFASQIMCYVVTCIISAATLAVVRYGVNNVMICSVTMGVSTIVLLLLVPVPTIEKPLDGQEEMMYGMIARAIIVVIAGIYEILFSCRRLPEMKIISATLCVVAVLAVSGKIKYMLYERNQ